MESSRKKPWVTTAIVLDTRVTKKDNTHPVKLRVTYNRKQKYYVIKGESYTEEQFAKISDQESRGINKEKRIKFNGIEERAIEVIDNELREFSFAGFEELYKRKNRSDSTIKDLFNDKIEELNKEGRFQTAMSYQASLNSFLAFDDHFHFDKITPQYLKKYEKWMVEVETEKKPLKSYTTTSIYLRNLRHIINQAIIKSLFSANDYPFGKARNGKYQIPSSKSFKRALSMAEIKQLFEYTPVNENEKIAKSYFIFSYLCNGMNMADIANLKWENIKGNHLTFLRQKTKNLTVEKKEINVYLLDEALQIIEDMGNRSIENNEYVFPIYSNKMSHELRFKRLKQHIQTTNKYLKRIGKKLGFEGDITTYWARHSYATILKRSGVSYEFIGEQFGHSSTKVTRNYLDTFEDEQRKKFAEKLTDFNSI
jgi:integrase/recombinase XerD